MPEGYSIKICLCWKDLVLEEHTLAPRFTTEEAAQAYSKELQAGPRLLQALREKSRNAKSEEGTRDAH